MTRFRGLPTIFSGIFAASLAAFAGVALAAEPPADAAKSLAPIAIDPPAPPGSTSPAIASEDPTTVSREHEIMMTWLAPGETGGQLKFARLSEGSWSRPITVARNVSALDPGDRPSLTVMDTQAVRRTLIARMGDVVARSGDGGRTWGRLPAPALPFASFAGGDEGGYVFWLAANGRDSGKLLGSRILAGETLLDEHAWYPSGTGSAMTWDGPVVVYRALSEGALDIALIRREDAQWTRPHIVHADGWNSARKPTSIPRVAAIKRRVAVAWYTEAQRRPRVRVAFSSDAGATFSEPVEVDAKAGKRRLRDSVDVTLDHDGNALVLWMATTPEEDTLNLARVSEDGKLGEPLILSKTHPNRLGGIPQIARAGDRVAVAWMEGVLRRVRAAAVPIAGIPALGTHRPRLAVATGPRKSRTKPAGDPAPDLELISLDGEKVSLAGLRGKAVLLNLWATWCMPCREEMPELAKIHEEFGPDGLAVVGVSVDDANSTDQVRAFVSQFKIPFDIWLDPKMRSNHALRVRGLPATFIIDREGRILLRRERAIRADEADIGEALELALGGY